MVKSGRHPDKALTTVQVRALKEPGRHADGNGLYLVVDPSGAKRSLLRTVVQGKRRDIGLGGLSLVCLSEAREKALAYRKQAREGGDPLAERRKGKASIPTFAEAAEQVYAGGAGVQLKPIERTSIRRSSKAARRGGSFVPTDAPETRTTQ